MQPINTPLSVQIGYNLYIICCTHHAQHIYVLHVYIIIHICTPPKWPNRLYGSLHKNWLVPREKYAIIIIILSAENARGLCTHTYIIIYIYIY